MPKILVVDDEARIRELIRKYAVYEGYVVDEAENGAQAIEKCRRESYDMIGFDAVRSLRAFSSAPVIMLSARSEELDRIHGFSLGVDDYVSKPFSPRELMMRIAAIRKRTSSAAGPVQPDVFLHGGPRA